MLVFRRASLVDYRSGIWQCFRSLYLLADNIHESFLLEIRRRFCGERVIGLRSSVWDGARLVERACSYRCCRADDPRQK